MEKFRVNLKNKLDKYIKINGITYAYFKDKGVGDLHSASQRGSTKLKVLFKVSRILNIDIRNLLMFGDYTYEFENSFDNFEEFLIFLGKRLKQFRINKKLRALDVAEKFGNIHIKNIYTMESSKSNISLKKFYEYLDILDVTPDEFFLKGENFSVKDKKSEYRNISVSDFYDRVFKLQDIQNVPWDNTININFKSFPTIFTFLKMCQNLKIYPKDFFDYNNEFLNKDYTLFDLEKTFSWIKNKINVKIVNKIKYIKLDSVFYFCDEESIDILDFFDESTLVGNIDQLATKITIKNTNVRSM